MENQPTARNEHQDPRQSPTGDQVRDPAQVQHLLTIAACLLLVAGPYSALEPFARRNLVVHMLGELPLLVAAGVVIALAIRSIPRLTWLYRAVARYPLLVIGVAATILLIWHLPGVGGRANPAAGSGVPYQSVSALEVILTICTATPERYAGTHLPWFIYLLFVASGFGLGVAVPQLGPFTRTLVGISSEGVMMLVGLGMVSGAIRYPGYSSTEVALAGVAMMISMNLVWVLLLLQRPSLNKHERTTV